MSKNVALVLSSGGARGFAHIGVINILQAHGYKITSVAGTSMGALVGGVYATGQLLEFEQWVKALDLREVLRLTDFSISTKGLVKGIKIFDKIKEFIPDRNIEDLLLPFCAVATDIIQGKEIVFEKGSLYQAVRASVSIPTVLQPYKYNDQYFVDGGVLNPIPVSRVKRHDNDILIVVDVNANSPVEKVVKQTKSYRDHKYFPQILNLNKKLSNPIPRSKADDLGLFNLTSKSISLMLTRISELTLEIYKPDVLISLPHESYGTYDFYKATDIIQAGEKIAEKVILEYES